MVPFWEIQGQSPPFWFCACVGQMAMIWPSVPCQGSLAADQSVRYVNRQAAILWWRRWNLFNRPRAVKQLKKKLYNQRQRD
jgi:hypothetical protein